MKLSLFLFAVLVGIATPSPSLSQSVPCASVTISAGSLACVPLATPTPLPTPVPVPTPTALSGAACLLTVNGQPWAPNCRPYAASAPWNTMLADVVAGKPLPAGFMTAAPASDFVWIGPANSSSDGSYPTYFSAATDPLWTVTCSTYCGVVPASVHAPANIKTAQGPDAHIALVDRTSGLETDGWDCTVGAGAIACAAVNQGSFLTGTGVLSPSTTSGAALGVPIRSDELARAFATADGVIPHVLPLVIRCVSGNFVGPFGTSNGIACSSGTSIPTGTHIQYTPTFATIDAMSISAYAKVMLRTLHRYGGAVIDTSAYPSATAGGGFATVYESADPYLANGTPIPWIALLGANGFVSDLGSGSMIGSSAWTADPNMAAHLQIVP